MNQQRSRRFRAAKESIEIKESIKRIREEVIANGGTLPPPKEKKEHFDSNCITPGTEFMDRLAKCLRFYMAERLANDPGWKNIKVVLSDANVPGEGEHKIMDYIRKQRAQPDHDPNTKHCLNGADADLIMLGLATHELHFTIMREEFKPGQKRPCEICGQVGHDKEDCEGLTKEQAEDGIEPFVGTEVEFIFIKLNVLREYLEPQLRMEGLPFKYDFERAIDDWVFMCFFVGNDFLPHLPSLEIREGAIDRLQNIYKKCLPMLGGYLSEGGQVNLKRVQKILLELGEMEDEIFRKRQTTETRFRNRRIQQNKQNRPKPQHDSPHGYSPRNSAQSLLKTPTKYGDAAHNKDLRNLLTPHPDGAVTPDMESPADRAAEKMRARREKEDAIEPEDNIKLHEEGWKERYYQLKFSISRDKDEDQFQRFRRHLALEYVRGLCWVLAYYFQGCPSWEWFYPFHYAPFASDFLDIEKMDTLFRKNTGPFKPLEQLMSVFPAASGNFLPPTWRAMMSAPDSNIIDFYPTNFKLDLNGKKFAWMGVALLPFIDTGRLHRTLATVYDDLTADEKRRNRRDNDVLMVSKANPLFEYIKGLKEGGQLSERQELVTDFSDGVRGLVWEDEEGALPGSYFPCPVPDMADIPSVQTISVKYENPVYAEGYIFPAEVLEKAVPPEKVLKPSDHMGQGGGRGGYGGGGGGWRPQTGMGRGNNQMNVTPGGHRMLNHELNRSGGNSPFNTPRGGGYGGGGGGGGYGGSPYGGNNYNNQSNWGSPRPLYNQQGQGGFNYGGQGGGGHQRSQSYQGGGYQQQQGGYQQQDRRHSGGGQQSGGHNNDNRRQSAPYDRNSSSHRR